MPANSVAIRLGVDGSADLKRTFDDVAKSGQTAFDSVAKAMDNAGQASDKQLARYQRLAQAARDANAASQSQSNINSLFGIGGTGKSAADSASVFQTALDAADKLQARTKALRETIDPLAAAHDRMGGSIKNADDLLAKGAITAAEHAAAIALAKRGYDAFAQSLKGANDNSALSTQQLSILGGAARHAFDAIAAGASPMRALTMEAGHLQAAVGPGGVTGLLSGLGSAAGRLAGILVSPVGAFLAIAAAVGTTAAAMIDYDNKQREVERSLQGIGRGSGATAAEINKIAKESASAGSVSVATARSMAAQYAATGQIGSAMYADLIKIAKDYGATTGQDAIAANKELAAAFADPTKGAVTLNEKLGFLDATTLNLIRHLQDQGDRLGAQRALLEAVSPSLGKASELTSGWARAWDDVKNSVSAAWTLLGQGPPKPQATQQYLDELKRQQAEVASQQGNTLLMMFDPSLPDRATHVAGELDRVTKALKQQGDTAKVAADLERRALTLTVDQSARGANPALVQLEQIEKQISDIRRLLDAGPMTLKIGGLDVANTGLEGLIAKQKQLTEDLKAGGSAFADMVRGAQYSASQVGVGDFARQINDINRRAEDAAREVRRNNVNPAVIDAQLGSINEARTIEINTARELTIRNATTQGGGISIVPENLRQLFLNAAQQTGAPLDLITSIARRESGFDTTADAHRNFRNSHAYGLMQLQPGTARDLGVDQYDPAQNVMGGAALIQQLLQHYNGDTTLALIAYKRGQGYVDALVASGQGVAGASPEDLKYVEDITKGVATTGAQVTYLRDYQRGLDEQGKTLDINTQYLGKNGLALDTATRAQQMLNEMQQRGVPISNDLVEGIRRFAEQGATAAQQLKALQLSRDIDFEREQLGRSSLDQGAYSRARSTFGDTNSPGAQSFIDAMRLNTALTDVKSTATSAFSGFLSDLRNGKGILESLNGVFGKFADRLTQLAADQAISQLFRGLGGMGLGNFLSFGTSAANSNVASYASAGSSVAAVGHTGGMFDELMSSRVVSSMLFYGAPRHHIGWLAPNERPAILTKDESVLTPGQMRAIGRAGAASSAPVTIKHEIINNHPTAKVSTREVDDGQGGRKPQTVIDEMFAGAVQSPKTMAAFRSGYGVAPRVARR